MKLLIQIARWHTPVFLRKRGLKKLMNITAEAFGCDPPPTSGVSFEDSLAAYAQFTGAVVERARERADNLQNIQDQLFRGAQRLGKAYRRRFRVSTPAEALEVSRILYRILGIQWESTDQGTITIRKCFFSTYYPASTCTVISSLDAGLMAGLSGGGALAFSQRITEGFDCCRAQLITGGYHQ